MRKTTVAKTAGAVAGAALIGLIALGGGIVGAWYYTEPGLPQAETIRDIPLQIPLRVYSRDGRLLAEIGEQRRIPVAFEDIPQHVVEAFIAAEDGRFFEHPGIDYQGVARAAVNFAVSGSRSQGGSTITQQLARDYFLTRERRFTRKIREAFLAWRIEKEFDKPEILAMFLNKMFFGQRAYGVAAAAQVYFGKELDELNVAEAATLAGVLPAPSLYNPVSGPRDAERRRGYVLRRMHELDFIDGETYREALDYPLESRIHGAAVELDAPYLAEMVRQEMIARYGSEIYSAGYKVVTTLDSELQIAAVDALRNGLLEYDRRHGYRGPLAHFELDAQTLDTERLPPALAQALADYPETGGLVPALVLALGEDDSARVLLASGDEVRLPWFGIRWAKPYIDDDRTGEPPENVGEVLEPGDVIYAMPTAGGEWALAQVPRAQGAIVALDPEDGAIVALSGGFDYAASKYNRAVQTKRQPGSAFKPFIYSAALENGFTAATVVNDAPVVLDSAQYEGTWRPKNYSGRFHGPTRLREALVRSLNLVSVRVLMKTGLSNALRHLRRFGFDAAGLPRDLSLALGSGAASPLDMAAGFAVFANGGYAVEPYFIDHVIDVGGEVIWRAEPAVVCAECEPPEEPEPREFEPGESEPDELTADGSAAQSGSRPRRPSAAADIIDKADRYRPDAAEAPELYQGLELAPRVLSPQNAYLVSDMMRDVIRRGTGRRALRLGRSDLSGKTGTSNDRRDAWFGGFNADLVATAWIGFDEDRPLGGREEGSRTALPVWMHFMEQALAGVPENPLPQPEGLVTVRISPATGEPAGANDADFVFETFREGEVPRRSVTSRAEDIYNDPLNSNEIEEPLF